MVYISYYLEYFQRKMLFLSIIILQFKRYFILLHHKITTKGILYKL